MEIEWGPEIAVDGKRPEWLGPDETIKIGNELGDWIEPASDRVFPWWGAKIIRLPASHPAYIAIAKGFTPWSGGDEAPGDWDGGDILFSFGNAWIGKPGHIIGYRRKSVPHREAVESMLDALPPISPQPIGSATIPANYTVTRKVGEMEITITGPDLAHILRSIKEDGNDQA